MGHERMSVAGPRFGTWASSIAGAALVLAVQVLVFLVPGSASLGDLESAPALPTPTPPCNDFVQPITCGSTFSGTFPSGTVQVVDYSCSPQSYPGDEAAFSILLPSGGAWTLTASLGEPSADLDVFLLGPGVCDPASCVATGDVTARFVGADGGSLYFAVIDGVSSSWGDPFEISITCEQLLFGDGFETGDLAGWSTAVKTTGAG